ncbi:MAG: NADH-quinone oxidoreductase subunit NuoE [Caulobacterales bacterium]
MALRRLAAEQPDDFAFNAESMALAQWWIAKYPPDRKQSAVIPLLWIAQKQDGWVSEPVIRVIAEMLGMARIRVYEVATFYTMFNLSPMGKFHLQVCGTTPCMLRGSNDLLALCKKQIGPKEIPSADGMLSWTEVECLGACVNAPIVQVNDDYIEDLDIPAFEAMIDGMRRGQAPQVGSTRRRQCSAPEGGATTLTDPRLYDGSRAQAIRLPNPPKPAAE